MIDRRGSYEYDFVFLSVSQFLYRFDCFFVGVASVYECAVHTIVKHDDIIITTNLPSIQ